MAVRISPLDSAGQSTKFDVLFVQGQQYFQYSEKLLVAQQVVFNAVKPKR